MTFMIACLRSWMCVRIQSCGLGSEMNVLEPREVREDLARNPRKWAVPMMVMWVVVIFVWGRLMIVMLRWMYSGEYRGLIGRPRAVLLRRCAVCDGQWKVRPLDVFAAGL